MLFVASPLQPIIEAQRRSRFGGTDYHPELAEGTDYKIYKV
jgi:hypothetical protein